MQHAVGQVKVHHLIGVFEVDAGEFFEAFEAEHHRGVVDVEPFGGLDGIHPVGQVYLESLEIVAVVFLVVFLQYENLFGAQQFSRHVSLGL